MLSEIGVVIGLYVVARLIPSSWRVSSRVASVITAVVAIFVVIDLLAQALNEKSLLSVFEKEAKEEMAADAEGLAAREVPTPTVTRADGGSITTNLGYGYALAKNSSLKREWIALHDPTLPVDLEGTPGISTKFVRDGYSSEYHYEADFSLITREPVQAVEVRFLIFDVWGDHVQTLSYEEVLDLPKGARKEFDAAWRVFTENDAARHYASIAYVARVRLADGKVLRTNDEPVLAEAAKFSEKFTAADLEPESKRRDDKQEPAPNPGAEADS